MVYKSKLFLHSQLKHMAIKQCALFGNVWFSALICHKKVTCGYLIVNRSTGLRVFNYDNLSKTILSCVNNMSRKANMQKRSAPSHYAKTHTTAEG